MVILGGLLVLLVCVDMGIKQYVEEYLEKGEERATKAPKIVLRRVHNRGFLLDLFDQCPKVIRVSSAVSGIAILIYDAWLACRRGKWLRKLGMVFVTAGAASNIYDRLARGKVVDYIGIKSRNGFVSRLTANLADVYVVIGIVLAGVSRMGRRK